MTANNNPVFNWEVSEKAKKVNQKLIDSKQNGEGYNPAADPKLGFEINCLKNKKSGSEFNPWESIDEYRSRTDGLEPLGDTIPSKGDNNGTVAFIEVNGNKVFGLNSSLLSDADKELGRRYFAEMKRAGYFENVDVYGRGSGQVFTHAECYSLMKAYSMYGDDIGKNVTIYCDRQTCGICKKNLQYFKDYFKLERLTVINKNGNIYEY